MKFRRISVRRKIYFIPLCLFLLATSAHAQQDEPDDVVRISTELIQTDVTVLDKEGRFVDGLKPEQFELFVDGKRQPISFFERVTAGTASEEAQLAAARGARTTLDNQSGVVPLDRGRVIIFFVDDLHMTPDSLTRSRKTILQFIDREMKQNDLLAITSANGQIGFLQQMTNNRAVLRAAVERLKRSQESLRDPENPPMSESMALAIQVKNDDALLQFFMAPLIQFGMSAQSAEQVVRGRASQILQQSYSITRNTLATLESLARTSARMPGRKLLFFISDGFMLNMNEPDILDRMRKITNASARTGLVIYAVDSRGLSSGVDDISAGAPFDPSGTVARATSGDISSSQEPLRVLAGNTGGRALLNTNSLNAGFTKALQETSLYYLLAWRPQSEAQADNKFRRIEVKITGRSDLNVQVRRGYYDLQTKAAAKNEKASADAKTVDAKTSAAELQEALKSPFPVTSLPTQLAAIYIGTQDKSALLAGTAQISSEFLTFNQADNKFSAAVDVAALVLDDQGKAAASFKDRLTISAPLKQTNESLKDDLIYTFQTKLKPGLYQVRVGTRDQKSGRTGSAMQWLEIPDLSQGKLTLSSLLLSETTKDALAAQREASQLPESIYSINRRFARSSKLRFMVFIYNAARGGAQVAPASNAIPDLALQVQFMRDDQPVLTTTLRKVETANGQDPARIPYVAEVPLVDFPPGRYALHVTVIDRVAKASASQRADFHIE